MADFIVDDSDMSECEVEEDDDEHDGSVFYIRTDRSLGSPAMAIPRRNHAPINFDSDSEEEGVETRPVFKTPVAPPGQFTNALSNLI